MFLITLRDLQWRRRRFVIAIVGTSLMFSMALTLSGLSHGFDVEAESAVRQLHASGWVVATGSTGPFLGSAPLPAALATAVGRVPGITAAGPVVYGRTAVGTGPGAKDANVFGAEPGHPGMPAVSSGRPPRTAGEVAVSTRLVGDYPLGSTIALAGRRYTVVGRVPNSTILAGVPCVFLTLSDAQRLVFGNLSTASTIAISGAPTAALPRGVVLESNHDAVADLERPLLAAHSAVAFIAVLLFLVAALIVGSMVYLSALERQRDFAVLKATGITSRSILGGLAIQSVLVSVGAAALALVLSLAIIPLFPLRVVVTNDSRILLPAVGVLVGVLASGLAIRRATAVDPALAFGGP